MRLSISITGKDRPGIIAALTKICYELKGNLEDASMTILAGEFAMILLVSFSRTHVLDVLRKKFKGLEEKLGLVIVIQTIWSRPKRGREKSSKTTPYLISIFGKDRAGIVYKISSLLACYGFNITDLNSKLIVTKKKNIYALLVEVDIPKRFRIGVLKRKLDQIARSMKIDLTLKSVEALTL